MVTVAEQIHNFYGNFSALLHSQFSHERKRIHEEVAISDLKSGFETVSNPDQ
jgi:hypothetical protein